MSKQLASPHPQPKAPCEQCGCSALGGDGDVRCDCGSLLARWVGGRIELKCRRCKRLIQLSVSEAPEFAD
jgi:hypothetical protein